MIPALSMELVDNELSNGRVDLRQAVVAIIAEAVNEGDYTVLNTHVSPGIVDASPHRLFGNGRAGLIEALELARRNMPDLYARIHGLRLIDTDVVEVHLLVTGTYAAPNLAPNAHDGRHASWRQRHVWWFHRGLAHAHFGRIGIADLSEGLGRPY